MTTEKEDRLVDRYQRAHDFAARLLAGDEVSHGELLEGFRDAYEAMAELMYRRHMAVNALSVTQELGFDA